MPSEARIPLREIDGDIVAERVEDQRMELMHARSVIAAARIIALEQEPSFLGTDAEGCLQVATRLLSEILDALDSAVLLAPAQEVASG